MPLKAAFAGFVTLLLFVGTCHAQKEVNFDSGPSFKDRVYTGGGFGFSNNANGALLSLSPIVGYMITRKLSGGVGITYQYYKDKIFDVEDHRYGGNIFLMQMLIYRVFAIGQYNFFNLNRAPHIPDFPRETFTRVQIGGGVSQPLGRASLNFMALYDITYSNDPTYPYASPWHIGAFISI